MNSATGQVIDVREADARVTVRVEAAVGCARCAAGRGCGAGLAGTGSRSFEFELPLPQDATELRVGDTVTLDLEPGNLLRMALLAYGAPLAGASLLAGMAYALDATEPVAVGAALLGLVGGMLLTGYRSRRGTCRHRMSPRLRAANGTPP